MARTVIAKVLNNTRSKILGGTAVYQTGFDNDLGLITIAPASYESRSTMPAIGIVREDIEPNAEGVVTKTGLVGNINTSATSVNASVFVGSGGSLTFTDPNDTNFDYYSQQLGTVTRISNDEGLVDLFPLEVRPKIKHDEILEVREEQHHDPVTAKNIGGGAQVFKQISAQAMTFRTIVAGEKIAITSFADRIEISDNQLVDHIGQTASAGQVAYWLDSDTITGESGFFWDSDANTLRLDNYLALRESVAPSQTSGYGKLFVKSSDSRLYFLDDSGNEFDLLAAGTGTPDTTFQSNKTFWNEAIYHLTIAADAYSASAGSSVPELTFQQNKAFWNDSIYHLRVAADGYAGGGGVSATQGSDGYVAFFTGSNSIAGDNDLFWDRVNEGLRLGASNLTVGGTVNARMKILRSDGRPGLVIEGDANLQADMALKAPNNATDEKIVQILVNTDGTFGIRAVNDAFVTVTQNLFTGDLGSGSVGINNSAPDSGSKLHVVGEIRADGAGGVSHTWRDTTAAVDGKEWKVQATGTLFNMFTVNDADSASGTVFMSATRSGNTVTNLTLATTTDITLTTAATPRVYVASDGKVGIGTTSPDQGLHVHKATAGTVTATANAIIVAENSTNGYLQFLVPDANEAGLLYGGPDNTIKSALIFNPSSLIQFRSGGNTTRMTLSADGNLGIGPNSGTPHATLTVNGHIALEELTAVPPAVDGYGYIYVRTDDKLYYRSGAGTIFDLTAASGVSATQGSDGYITFFTGSNTIAGDNDFFYDRVNSRVGIGTSAPAVDLDVSTSREGNIQIRSVNLLAAAGANAVVGSATGGASGGDPILLMTVNGVTDWSVGIDNSDSDKLKIGSANTPGTSTYLTIDTTGNVGIGTESPDSKLDVSGNVDNVIRFDVENANTGTNASAGFRIIMTDASDAGNINFFQWGVNYTGTLAGISRQHASEISAFATSRMLIGTANTTAPIHFITNGIYAATISADQALGIGTQFPIEALTVNGTIALQELTANPATQDGYGKIFVRDDNKLYYKDGLGVVFDLTTGTGGGVSETTFQENKNAQGEINHQILAALDGYASDITVSEHYQQHSQAISLVILELDGYTTNTTFQENKAAQEEINDTILKALDGYGTGSGTGTGTVTSAQGYDGYVAFFTGQDALAGDNDLFWDRETNSLGIGTSEPNEKLTVNGSISLAEVDSEPEEESGFGKLYVRNDGKLFFVKEDGIRYDLTAFTGDVDGGNFVDILNFIPAVDGGDF